jgi:hypothetical protein
MGRDHEWSASRFAKVFAPGETRSFRPWPASEITRAQDNARHTIAGYQNQRLDAPQLEGVT